MARGSFCGSSSHFYHRFIESEWLVIINTCVTVSFPFSFSFFLFLVLSYSHCHIISLFVSFSLSSSLSVSLSSLSLIDPRCQSCFSCMHVRHNLLERLLWQLCSPSTWWSVAERDERCAARLFIWPTFLSTSIWHAVLSKYNLETPTSVSQGCGPQPLKWLHRLKLNLFFRIHF